MQKNVNLLVKQLDEAQNNANPHEYTALTHGRLLYAHRPCRCLVHGDTLAMPIYSICKSLTRSQQIHCAIFAL